MSRVVGEDNILNFRLARDQVVHLETAVDLSASRRQANNFFAFFSIFKLGGISKHLMTGSAGNSESYFPSTLNDYCTVFSGDLVVML